MCGFDVGRSRVEAEAFFGVFFVGDADVHVLHQRPHHGLGLVGGPELLAEVEVAADGGPGPAGDLHHLELALGQPADRVAQVEVGVDQFAQPLFVAGENGVAGLDRKLGEYEVPAHWAIIAAGNRQGDRGVTYSMPAPLANRFSHYELDVNLDDWVSWAYARGMDERLIAFLRFRPELLFEFDPAHNPVAFPSPRSWEFTHRALQKFSGNSQVLVEALQACVGPAAGIELHAFVDNLDKLPDIDAITRGESVAVPKETDLQYAVASALVGRAIRARDNGNAQTVYGHIIDYAGSFPQREMGVMLISDMHRAIGQDLFQVPQFSKWAKAVADVMLFDM